MASDYIVTAVSMAEQHTDAPTECNAKLKTVSVAEQHTDALTECSTKPKTDACPKHPPFAGAYYRHADTNTRAGTDTCADRATHDLRRSGVRRCKSV